VFLVLEMDEQLIVNLISYVNRIRVPIGEIPTYSDVSESGLPSTFIRKFQQYASCNKWNLVPNSNMEQEMLLAVPFVLKGAADVWYSDLDDDDEAKLSWNGFKNGFITRFTIPGQDAINFHIYSQRVQQDNESVEDYAEALRRLVRNIGNKDMVPVVVQVTNFINGLVPIVRLQMNINGNLPVTLDEAVMQARIIECAYEQYYDTTAAQYGSDEVCADGDINYSSISGNDDDANVVEECDAVDNVDIDVRYGVQQMVFDNGNNGCVNNGLEHGNVVVNEVNVVNSGESDDKFSEDGDIIDYANQVLVSSVYDMKNVNNEAGDNVETCSDIESNDTYGISDGDELLYDPMCSVIGRIVKGNDVRERCIVDEWNSDVKSHGRDDSLVGSVHVKFNGFKREHECECDEVKKVVLCDAVIIDDETANVKSDILCYGLVMLVRNSDIVYEQYEHVKLSYADPPMEIDPGRDKCEYVHVHVLQC
jgi:hypothetical protein